MVERDCTKYESWIYEYVDGELPPIARAEFEEALEDCPALARRVKELRMLDERLQEVFLHFAPPEGIEKAIAEGLPDPKRLLGVPLFGEIAVALGFTTKEAVTRAIQEQKRRKLDGKDSLVGEILVEMGEMTPDQVKKTLDIQSEQGRPETLGGFEIIEQVGRGGMGVVYRARQLSMDRDVAIKILYPRLAADRKFVESFLKEAHAVAQLNHPNIITGIDAGEERGYIYLAMEYVDGPTLRQILKRDGKIPEGQAIDIALQVAEALEYARKQNFIHRDIKPDNIMLGKSGVVKVCDLGLAKRGEQDILAEEGEAVGTPHYLSPEQATGRSDIDTRSDIYSLGATLYHAVTGTTPFTGRDAREIMSKHVNAPLEPPREREPGISEGLEAIILKMMAKDPSERYSTPADLIRDLQLLKAGRPPVALQEKLIREGKLDPSVLLGRRKRSIAAVAALLLVLAGAGAAVMMNNGKEEPRRSLTPRSRTIGTATPTPTPESTRTREVVPPERRREMIAELEKMPAGKPEELEALARKAAEVHARLLGTPEGVRAGEILAEALKSLREAAGKLLAERKLQAERFVKEGKYAEALEAFGGLPEYARLSPLYASLTETLHELNREIEKAVEKRLEEARKATKAGRFDEAEGMLAKLAGEAPAEYLPAVTLAVQECREARHEYARRQSDIALAAILDNTLNGEFDKARKMLERYLADPVFEAYRERFSSATEYIEPIEEVMKAALKRLKELEGKRVSLRLKGEYDERKFKILEVKEDGIRVMELAPGTPKRTLSLSDIDPAGIAALARQVIMKRPKPEQKGAGLHALAVYLLFSGRFYDADKAAEEAEKFGVAGGSFDAVKRKYRRMLLNRFAVALLRKFEEAFEKGDYERVLETGKRLKDEFGESEVVTAKEAFIEGRMARARLETAGVTQFFRGKVSVTDAGYVAFDYDFDDPLQMADFAFDPEVWRASGGELVVGEDSSYRKGLHHFAVFARYAEMRAEYRNDRPNSVCFRLGGSWFGVNSFNGTGGIIPSFDEKKLWDGFSVNKTGFAFRMDGFVHRLRVVANGGGGLLTVDGKKLLEGRVAGRPSSFEMRDLGFARIRKLHLEGELDEKWLGLIGEVTSRMRKGTLARGLKRTLYSDLYFSRRVKEEVVRGIDAKFEMGSLPKRIKEPVYSLKYEGLFLAPEAGEYSFHMTMSARLRLRIDGAAIADNLQMRDRPDPNTYAKVKLEPGLHRFELFIANDGERFLVLRMRYDAGTGGDFPMPGILFYHEPEK